MYVRTGITAVVALCAGTALATPTLTRIPTLGGSESVALDINDHGQVVGQALIKGDSVAHAYLWSNGEMTDLGSLGENYSSSAWAINNNGEIVGESDFNEFGAPAAMYWHDGKTINLNQAMNAGTSVAWDINDNGVIVGQGSLGPGFSKGFIYTPGTGGIAAGTLQGHQGGSNRAINNSNIVVGDSFFFGDPSKAHRAERNDRGDWVSEEIGPGLQSVSFATDINSHGVITGYANNPSGPWEACIFTLDPRDPIISLGTLPGFFESEANAINDSNVVVGFAYPDPEDPMGIPHAWAYFDGQMHDLNDYLFDVGLDSDFQVLVNALSINNNGDIVGTGLTHDGFLAGFVLSGVVPAPGAGALLALAGLAAARRRRN